jgi:hypothetical protein
VKATRGLPPDCKAWSTVAKGGFEPPVPRGTLAFKFCLYPFGQVSGTADVQLQR